MIKLILYVAWLYAWIVLQITKTFYYIMCGIIKLPDYLICMPRIVKGIEVLDARDDNDDVIINKIKLYIYTHFENAADSIHESNGINVRELFELLDTKLVHIVYKVLCDNTDTADTASTANESIKSILLEKIDDTIYFFAKHEKVKLFMNYLKL